MGTNFYYFKNKEKEPDNKVHIGLSSGGWCFGLHVYPTEGIWDLKDWINLFKAKYSSIEDEYGNSVHIDEMKSRIKDREGNKTLIVGETYTDLEKFFEVNDAQLGPNRLLRRKVRYGCVGHGEGTWDLIVGDFE